MRNNGTNCRLYLYTSLIIQTFWRFCCCCFFALCVTCCTSHPCSYFHAHWICYYLNNLKKKKKHGGYWRVSHDQWRDSHVFPYYTGKLNYPAMWWRKVFKLKYCFVALKIFIVPYLHHKFSFMSTDGIFLAECIFISTVNKCPKEAGSSQQGATKCVTAFFFLFFSFFLGGGSKTPVFQTSSLPNLCRN